MKTISDYLSWRTPEKAEANKPKPAAEWRPPVYPREYMYDKPQTKLFSPLDRHPIIDRVLIKPAGAAQTAFPIWRTPGFHFFAGAWTGAMLVLVFTCKPLARKEIEDLVKYDPAYFPEYAKAQ